MRKSTSGPGTRLTMLALSLLLVLPSWGVLLVGPAAAQAAGERLSVAVLDLTDRSPTPPPVDLSREITDALATQMARSAAFDVTSRKELEDALVALGTTVTPPYNTQELQDIGRTLDVRTLLVGEFKVESVSKRGDAYRVSVTVGLMDVVAGEYVNGADGSVEVSRPGYQGPMAVFFTDAVSDLAQRLTRDMVDRRVPNGVVMIVTEFKGIEINVGEREGYREDMELAIVRGVYDADLGKVVAKRVGKMRVGHVYSHYGYGELIEGTVQPQDQVRALYAYKALGAVGKRARVKTKNLTRTLLVFAVLWGLASVFQERNAASHGPGAVAARSLGTADGENILTWSKPPGTPDELSDISSRVVGYFMYRSTSAIPGTVPSNLVDFVGQARATAWADTQASYVYAQSVTIDENGLVEFGDPDPALGVGPGFGADFDIEAVHTPVTPGTHYFYAVASLVALKPRIITTGGGTTGGGGGGGGVGGGGGRQGDPGTPSGWTLVWSNPSPVTGPATPLSQVPLVSPPNKPDPGSGNINENAAVLTWLSVLGGDIYVVQVSSTPTFSTGTVMTSTEQSMFGAAANVQMSATMNLASFFGSSGTSRTFYWRVGVRYSQDQYRPYPDGYVWSLMRAFDTAELPPPPPT